MVVVLQNFLLNVDPDLHPVLQGQFLAPDAPFLHAGVLLVAGVADQAVALAFGQALHDQLAGKGHAVGEDEVALNVNSPVLLLAFPGGSPQPGGNHDLALHELQGLPAYGRWDAPS